MPNGTYAMTLAMTSKRVQRSGHGANGQNGVSGVGRDPGRERLQARERDREPVEQREGVRQQRAMAPRDHGSRSVLRTTVTFSCVAIGAKPAATNIDSEPW